MSEGCKRRQRCENLSWPMRILYITGEHCLHRREFFEQLGLECELVVAHEVRCDAGGDAIRSNDLQGRSYRDVFLSTGVAAGFKALRGLISEGWDVVVVGCCGSKVQMLTIGYLRHKKLRYAVNFDGPLVYLQPNIRRAACKHALRGADLYLVAGRTSVGSVRREAGIADTKIVPYSFTSLTEAQLSARFSLCETRDRELILCVGQFLPHKGVDVLLDAFEGMQNKNLHLRVIGAKEGNPGLVEAIKKRGLTSRAEAIPYLPPEKLALEYARAGMLVLPSRKESWDFVVNEAAACGCPIVSTWGAGAAVEFLYPEHVDLLAEPDNAGALRRAILAVLSMPTETLDEYSDQLRRISVGYSIEVMVREHLDAFVSLVGCSA